MKTAVTSKLFISHVLAILFCNALSAKPSLITQAQAALMQELKNQYTRVNLKPLSETHDNVDAKDDFKTAFTVTYPVAKRVCVWLIPRHHHNKHRSVWFKVHAYSPVWVAKRHLQPNTLLRNDDFSREERDISGQSSAPVKALPQAIWLTSSLDAHALLLQRQLKDPPLVTPLQHVQVWVHHHHVHLTLDAIALSEGYLGQTITVKNPSNQQTFMARVRGVEKAEITS